MIRNLSSIFFILTVCVSCSPKVTLAPSVKNEIPITLAILPPEYPSGIQKERVDYLHDSLAAELRGSNYVVLDRTLTSRICTSHRCPERETLATNYGVKGFVSLEISSVSRNNFLAGYYNAISGVLNISDVSNANQARVEYTEQEKGGLVFNSGQVFQGIISQVRNANSEREDLLADRFIKSLVSSLPKLTPQTVASQNKELAISSVSTKELKPRIYRVCAHAPAGQMASLRYNGLRATLREEPAGTYCGIFRHELASSRNPLAVEIRSPYGITTVKNLALKGNEPCELDGRVKLVSTDGRNQITIECLNLSKMLAKTSTPTCENGVVECDIHKFLVYRSPSEAGPFQKVAEITEPNWTDRPQPQGTYYAIIAVDGSGAQSVPIPVTVLH